LLGAAPSPGEEAVGERALTPKCWDSLDNPVKQQVRAASAGQRGDFAANARRFAMSIIGWLVLGLIAGFIASKIVNKAGEGVILDMILGIVGAVVGGFLFAQFGAEGVTGFNIYSMFVAVIGAIVVLFIYHAVVGRRGV
jgi:uncharacterized membrane protein YeaQ/YmgE (transglycosylase-associated protein family)